MNRKIHVKSLKKLLRLFEKCVEKRRFLTIREIMQEIGCSRGHAYNYLKALNELFRHIKFQDSP